MLKKINRYYPSLRAAMKTNGISHTEIARHLDRSTSYVDHIMSGDVSPRLCECYKIIEMIGADTKQIFEFFPADIISNNTGNADVRLAQSQIAKSVTDIGSKMEEISIMLRTLGSSL